jgi:hypothetical protein
LFLNELSKRKERERRNELFRPWKNVAFRDLKWKTFMSDEITTLPYGNCDSNWSSMHML